MITYRYFAKPKDAVMGSGEIRRDAIDRFFQIVLDVSGKTRPEAEAILHAGKRIESKQFDIWAEAINPFKPAKLI